VPAAALLSAITAAYHCCAKRDSYSNLTSICYIYMPSAGLTYRSGCAPAAAQQAVPAAAQRWQWHCLPQAPAAYTPHAAHSRMSGRCTV
jgi:hypothetical protein